MNCLLYSDNDLISEFQQQLDQLGIPTLHCQSAERALTHLQQDVFELLVLDANNQDNHHLEDLLSLHHKRPPMIVYLSDQKLPLGCSKKLELALPIPNNALSSYLQTLRQLTDSRKALVQQKKRYDDILEYSQDGMLSIDTSGIIRFISPTTAEIFAYQADELIGMSFQHLLSEKYHHQYELFLKRYGENATEALVGKEQDLEGQRKNAEHFPLGLTICGVNNDSQLLITALVRDLSSQKAVEEKLTQLTHYDHLTGLPNRSLLLNRLGHSLIKHNRQQRTLAILYLDLDRFKIINETMGHELGDQLLHQAAIRLQQCTRKGDTIARTGGDEFTILLEELSDTQDAALVAENACKSLAQPFLINGDEFYVTVSIGIATNDDPSLDGESLLQNADIALYRAKDEGRNTYEFYSPEQNAVTLYKITLETALHKALENNELELYYQPQLDIASGHIIGAEALLRWNHPKAGFVSPVEFIPLLEDTGLIVPVGNWVLEHGCQQWQQWLQQGLLDLDATISINLSARQFGGSTLIRQVEHALKISHLPAKNLVLEITESILMSHTKHTQQTLENIKEKGVCISLDDFGTGYSSLSYLTQFPIDHLKIDRSFLNNILESSQDAALATAIIRMAQSLSLDVVAEGVDSEEKLEFLRQRRCHFYQGFLYAKPLPADEFIKKIQSERLSRLG